MRLSRSFRSEGFSVGCSLTSFFFESFASRISYDMNMSTSLSKGFRGCDSASYWGYNWLAGLSVTITVLLLLVVPQIVQDHHSMAAPEEHPSNSKQMMFIV